MVCTVSGGGRRYSKVSVAMILGSVLGIQSSKIIEKKVALLIFFFKIITP
jgi:hypothetical protein